MNQLDSTDGASQQAVADRLRLHRNVMVGLVDGLQQAGLVERRANPKDRRAHALCLTPAGRKTLAKGRGTAMRIEHEIVAGLDPDEMHVLVPALKKVSAALGLTAGVHPRLHQTDSTEGMT